LRQEAEDKSRSQLLFIDSLTERLSVETREKTRLQEQIERDKQFMASLQADLRSLQAQLQEAHRQQPATAAVDGIEVEKATGRLVQGLGQGGASKVTQPRLGTRLQSARSHAHAVKQAERYWNAYSEWYIVAQAKVNNLEPAGKELYAMDKAYYCFSFFMRECDRLATA
jgi:DNA repair exonuclease SbcCD ATPase subunit